MNPDNRLIISQFFQTFFELTKLINSQFSQNSIRTVIVKLCSFMNQIQDF